MNSVYIGTHTAAGDMDGKFANLEAFLESYNSGPYVLDKALYEELASLVDSYFGLEDQIQFCEASVKDMFRAHEKSVQKFSRRLVLPRYPSARQCRSQRVPGEHQISGG